MQAPCPPGSRRRGRCQTPSFLGPSSVPSPYAPVIHLSDTWVASCCCNTLLWTRSLCLVSPALRSGLVPAVGQLASVMILCLCFRGASAVSLLLQP